MKNAGSAALAALVLVLVVVALRVDVMGADALDYVNNARAMTSRAAILVDKHPPLLGFALAPVAGLDWLRVAPATELAVARLYGVGALGVVALATVSAARSFVSEPAASLAVFLVAFDRVLVHEAPLLEKGVFATAIVSVALALYARAARTGRRRDLAWVGLAIAGACLARWESALLGVALALVELVVPGKPALERVRRVAIMGAVALGTLVVSVLLAFAVFDRVYAMPERGLERIVSAFRVFETPFTHSQRDPTIIARILFVAFGPVALALALVGAVRAVRTRQPVALAALAASSVFFAFYSFVVKYQVARYEELVVPGLAILAAFGAEQVLERVPERRRLLAASGFALASVLLGAFEVSRFFTLGVYRSDYPEAVVSAVRSALGPGGEVRWARGNRFQRPADGEGQHASGLVLVSGDSDFYNHVFGMGELSFRLRRPVSWIPGVDGRLQPVSLTSVLLDARDGDAVCVSDLLSVYAFPPARHEEPLQVVGLSREDLVRQGDGFAPVSGRDVDAISALVQGGKLVLGASRALGTRVAAALDAGPAPVHVWTVTLREGETVELEAPFAFSRLVVLGGTRTRVEDPR